MEDTIRSNVDAAYKLLHNVQIILEQGPITKEGSTEIRHNLRQAHEAVGLSFSELRAIRGKLFTSADAPPKEDGPTFSDVFPPVEA